MTEETSAGLATSSSSSLSSRPSIRLLLYSQTAVHPNPAFFQRMLKRHIFSHALPLNSCLISSLDFHRVIIAGAFHVYPLLMVENFRNAGSHSERWPVGKSFQNIANGNSNIHRDVAKYICQFIRQGNNLSVRETRTN